MGQFTRQRFTVDDETLWRRATAWLLFLGPFFFISYGMVNAYTAGRDDVGKFLFNWEQYVPFWDWTIIPYMSIDLLYAISLFLCRTRLELDQHARRLLLATVVCVICFLLFPLQFTFIRPETTGIYGWLFDLLTSFDKPYNQAPSLHICLLVFIWMVFNRHIKDSFSRLVMHCWMLLIGLSVLTTWQHHFIDVISGLGVALILNYLLPDPPLHWHWQSTKDPASNRLAIRYLLGSVSFTTVALLLGGGGLVLLWPAFATLMVSLAYAGAGVSVFQHGLHGMRNTALIVLAPYLLAARCSAWWLSRSRPSCVQVVDKIWLGCVPDAHDLRYSGALRILNLTTEIVSIRPKAPIIKRVPMLDLVAPQADTLKLAIESLEQMAQSGQPVLVHCALGLSRSVLVIAGWLIYTGRVSGVDQALTLLTDVQPDCVIGEAQKQLLYDYVG